VAVRVAVSEREAIEPRSEVVDQKSMDESEYLSVDEFDAAGEIFVTCNGQSW
jgi:hypothetical protein